MGLYSHLLFPRGLDWLMSRPPFPEIRQALLANVEGKVLEVGFGTGLNLPHYPDHIRTLTTVDPNPGMTSLARKRMEASPLTVELHVINGEQLPMSDNAFDTVVSTWTLCSITNVERALGEIRRVLKPDGRFFFIEHGLSNEPRVQRWQHFLTPFQRIYADGCHLNRDIPKIIEGQGLTIVQFEQFYLDGAPKSQGCMFRGIAARADGPESTDSVPCHRLQRSTTSPDHSLEDLAALRRIAGGGRVCDVCVDACIGTGVPCLMLEDHHTEVQ